MASITRKLKWVSEPFEAGGDTVLKKNVIYSTGKSGTRTKYYYTTDDMGRITSAHARPLKLPEKSPRAPHAQNTPGKLEGDHAGHLFGDRFGGSPELDNLVSQASSVNLSKFKKIENDWARRLAAGEKFDVDITIHYGADARPVSFTVKEILSDGTVKAHRPISN